MIKFKSRKTQKMILFEQVILYRNKRKELFFMQISKGKQKKNESLEINLNSNLCSEQFIKMIKRNGGITLIALVITIIVLLILARSSSSKFNRR